MNEVVKREFNRVIDWQAYSHTETLKDFYLIVSYFQPKLVTRSLNWIVRISVFVDDDVPTQWARHNAQQNRTVDEQTPETE